MKRIVVFTALFSLALGALAPAVAADRSRFVKDPDAPLGDWVVELSVDDGGQRILAVSTETDIELQDIDSLTFLKKIIDVGAAGFNPMVLLGIDKDGDGKYEAQDFKWQFSGPNHNAGLLRGDTFLQCEEAAAGTPDPTFVEMNVVGSSFRCYGPNEDGTAYGQSYEPLTTYQAGSLGFAPDARVKAVKIVIGGAPSWLGFKVLIDAVKLNKVILIDDKSSNAKTERVTNPAP